MEEPNDRRRCSHWPCPAAPRWRSLLWIVPLTGVWTLLI